MTRVFGHYALRYAIRAHPQVSLEAAELLVALGADVRHVEECNLSAMLRPSDSSLSWRILRLARWLVERASAQIVPWELMDFIIALPSGDRNLVWDWDHPIVTGFLAPRCPAAKRCIQAWRETIS
jgi:hypothetical protein